MCRRFLRQSVLRRYATFSFFLAWVAVAVYFIGRDYMYIMYHLDVTDHYGET